MRCFATFHIYGIHAELDLSGLYKTHVRKRKKTGQIVIIYHHLYISSIVKDSTDINVKLKTSSNSSKETSHGNLAEWSKALELGV